LPGHPERGEEAFVVERRTDGTFFSITAFSRPVRVDREDLVAPLPQSLVHDVGVRETLVTAMRLLARKSDVAFFIFITPAPSSGWEWSVRQRRSSPVLCRREGLDRLRAVTSL